VSGGDAEAGSLVDEQWLLDLERHHFMELLATGKSNIAEEREAVEELSW